MEAKQVQRRYDLDWLRVLAFTGVFFYHCSRFFNSSGWHIKNAQTSPLIDIFTDIFDLWGMPLIFAISGASIYFALRPGKTVHFFRQRALRLLVPLAMGILVLAPPQVYLDRLSHAEFSGTLLEFIPHFFQSANFAWTGVHLWYLEYLFLFTLILAPLFIWLKRPAGQNSLSWLSRLSVRNGVIFFWALPFALLAILIDPFGLTKAALSEALLRLVVDPIFLVYGYLIFADNAIQQAIIRQRRISLVLALTSTLLAPIVVDAVGQPPPFSPFAMLMVLASLLIWSTILAILGYGMRYLTASNRLISYANEAVLPFYILHQPVILPLGYFIIPLQLPILAKYLIITPLALGISLGLYEFGIRRLIVLRRVFGLKPHKQFVPAADLAAQPSS